MKKPAIFMSPNSSGPWASDKKRYVPESDEFSAVLSEEKKDREGQVDQQSGQQPGRITFKQKGASNM